MSKLLYRLGKPSENEVQQVHNLNRARIRTDGRDKALENHSGKQGDVFLSDLSVVFNDQCEPALVQAVDKYDSVVGCVAWLTSEKVLAALARKTAVAIVLQKEDFLRPDGVGKETLRRLYSECPSAARFDFPGTGALSMCADPSLPAFRCVGVKKRKGSVTPIMHHKFLVFGNMRVECKKAQNVLRDLDPFESPYVEVEERIFEPQAVWTGSYNPTRNANRSFENALLIEDSGLASIYYKEWVQIMSLSEPLNWESEWVAPEWKIGT